MQPEHELKPAKIQPEGTFYRCPSCGYTDGFHVSFHFQENSDKAGIILICPSCHQRLQIGWNISIAAD
ncbi:MAG TPA: hypothetical protein VJL89_13910 [Thermodesulfovibrionia bacterium]|nr:hypothetical protein [Thermodesulfovibrionia bacterium]